MQALAAIIEIPPALIVQANATHQVIVHGGRPRNGESLGDLARKQRVVRLAH